VAESKSEATFALDEVWKYITYLTNAFQNILVSCMYKP